MTEKIQRRGVKTPDAFEPDILQGVAVRQLAVPLAAEPMPEQYIYASEDAGLAAEMMGRYNTNSLTVKDDKDGDKVIGMVTAHGLLQFYSDQREKERHYQSPSRTKRMMAHGRKLFRTINHD